MICIKLLKWELSPLLFFQISLGLITAKATHIVYPRWKRLESIEVSDNRIIKEHERLNMWKKFYLILECDSSSNYVLVILKSGCSHSGIFFFFCRFYDKQMICCLMYEHVYMKIINFVYLKRCSFICNYWMIKFAYMYLTEVSFM